VDLHTFVFEVLPVVSTISLGLALARILWVATLRPFGLFEQAHYRYTLLVPWRFSQRLWMAARRWFERVFTLGTGASASWASTRATMTLTFKPGDLYLGTQWAWGFPTYQPLGIDTERGAATIAAPGTGKSVHLISQIGLHSGSAAVIDVKGQIARVLYRPGDALLDGYNQVPNAPTSTWNPLEELARAEARHGPDSVVRFSAIMAEGLIRTQPGEKQPHFPNSAREFLQGLILHVYTTESGPTRTMLRVRDLLSGGYPAGGGIDGVIQEMELNQAYGGLISRRGTALKDTGTNERGGILSTARLQTAYWDYPEIRKISGSSSFALEELKTGTLRLFISAPATDLQGPLSGWSRLILSMLFYTFESIPGRLDVPCYVVADEFPALGHLASVERAAGLMRGYGIRLHVVAQFLEQLIAVYPSTYETFLASCDAVFWLGSGSMKTTQYLSGVLGKAMRKEKLDGGWPTKQPTRHHRVERELATPDQLKRFMSKGIMICTRMDRAPLKLRVSPYYEHLHLSRYSPDPDHAEDPLRAWARQTFFSQSPSPSASSRSTSRPSAQSSQPSTASRSNSPAPATTAATSISYPDALSLYGLQEPFRATEVHQRHSDLQTAAQRSQAYAQAVDDARRILLRRAAA